MMEAGEKQPLSKRIRMESPSEVNSDSDTDGSPNSSTSSHDLDGYGFNCASPPLNRESSTSSHDLGGYDFDPASPLPLNREVRDYIISQGPQQPKHSSFPRDMVSGRAFRSEWYKKVEWKDWLEYSFKQKAAFCFYCRIFSSQVPAKADETFIHDGYTNWKKATEKRRGFDKHLQSQCHNHIVFGSKNLLMLC